MDCNDFKGASDGMHHYHDFKRVVFYGDSITQGLHDEAVSQSAFGGTKLVDLAIVGSGLFAVKAKTLKGYIDQIQPNDLVFVSLGTNDSESARLIGSGYIRTLEKRLGTIQSNGGEIVLLGLDMEESRDLKRFPKAECYARETLNKELYELAGKLGVQFIDRSDVNLRRSDGTGDGLHPKDENNLDANDYAPMLKHIKDQMTLDLPVSLLPAAKQEHTQKM